MIIKKKKNKKNTDPNFWTVVYIKKTKTLYDFF